jgi:hypothetical protein
VRADSGPADAPTPVAAAEAPKPEPPTEVLVELHGVPAGGRVLVDGQPMEGNPLKLPRGTGEHQISIEAPGLQTWSVMHDAARDGRYAVSMDALEPAKSAGRPRSGSRSSAVSAPPAKKGGLVRRPDF